MSKMTLKNITRALFASLACLLTSCPVDQRLAWSPDGKTGLINGSSGLQIMDAEGKLGAVVAKSADSFAWLPDNRSLLVVRRLEVKTWPEAKALLGSQEIERVERLASALPDFLKLSKKLSGDKPEADLVEALKPYGISLNIVSKNEVDGLWNAATMAADPKAIAETMAPDKDGKTSDPRPEKLVISELSLIRLGEDGKASAEATIIERSVKQIRNLAVAKKGDCVAYVRGQTGVVRHVPTGTAWEVPRDRVVKCAWSPDGGVLYTITMPGAAGDELLGVLSRRTLAFEGKELQAGDEKVVFDAMLAPSSQSMAVLPDGRVVFTSVEVHPAAENTGPSFLFILDPATYKISKLASSHGLPTLSNGFSVSESGKSIAIMQSQPAILAVLDLASGAIEEISSVDTWDDKTSPEWRGEELYFASASNDAAHPDLMRWKRGGKPQSVSTSWPDEMRDVLMTKRKKDEKPAQK